MKLYVKTYGCQMNVHDSRRIAEVMAKVGYLSTAEVEEADLIVVNTCSIREKARQKGISEIGRLCAAVKLRRPETVVAVAGCVSQQEGNRIFEAAPMVDLVLGPDRYADLPELVSKARGGNTQLVSIGFDEGRPQDYLPTSAGQNSRPVSEYLTIGKGCNEKCSYCIVPSVRGPERFREPQDIIREARTLIGDGAKEITLLGQKVNAYMSNGKSFTDLLHMLDEIPGLSRLRFTSPHPRHMTPELIRTFGRLRTLCEAIHLPVQSGSDGVLEKMGRRYTAGFYKEIVHNLREACPEIMISTDLIVGYPEETQADFRNTLDLLETVRFSGVFSFKFSCRPGTPAASLSDDVPIEEKERKLEQAHEVINRIERETRMALVGKSLDVLVVARGRNPGQLTGRARNNQIVNFFPAKSVTLEEARGELTRVEITKALPHSLEGIPVGKGLS